MVARNSELRQRDPERDIGGGAGGGGGVAPIARGERRAVKL